MTFSQRSPTPQGESQRQDTSPIAFIEAKAFSKSENEGRSQARTYREDTRKQIGENLPYFLTNGHKWLYVDQDSTERPVSGPFSQSDLARRNEMYRKRTDPTLVPIEGIVSRPRSIRKPAKTIFLCVTVKHAEHIKNIKS